MVNNISNEYFQKKIGLLKQFLNLSEIFISSLDEWESLDGILAEREVILQQLKSNEESYGEAVSKACSEDQKKEIDQLIQLIIDLDKESDKKIREGQREIIQSIKANVQEQKFTQYGSMTLPQSGRLLDYKK